MGLDFDEFQLYDSKTIFKGEMMEERISIKLMFICMLIGYILGEIIRLITVLLVGK